VSEQSDGDRTADGLQKVDGRQPKHSSPGLNSLLDPVNGKQSKAFNRDLIASERNPPARRPSSEGERMNSAQTVDADGSMANGQESPVNIDDVDNENVANTELDSRRRQSPHQQPKKIISRERKQDDRRQTRSTSPKNPYGRSVRPSLIQTPVVWPQSNVPQGWPQFGGYHYPTQSRMPAAPLALISPYTPTYVPLTTNARSGDSRRMSSPPSSSSNYSGMQSSQHGEKLSKTNLYIRGLPPTTTDEDLVNMCSVYGVIISTKAILDKDTNKCKGYGFVDFDSPHSAQLAVSALQSKGVQAQMARQQEQDPTNLYLSNLPKTLDEDQLQNMLSRYGRVVSTRILKDGNGHSKGVGFARMESREICEAIIGKFCGQNLQGGGSEPLLVKFADGGPKKRPQHQEKVWRENEGAYLTTYDVGHSTSPINTTGNTRVTPVMPSHMISYTQGTNSTHFQQPVTAGWVQSQPYAVAVPMSPTSVEPHSITHVQQSVIPHLTSQMAQMQLPSGGYLTSVPTVPGYGPQSSWHVSQQQAPSHRGQVEESHFIVGSPDPHEAAVPHIHAGSAHQIQHPSEAILDDHHRMIYATYPRK